MSPKKIVIDSDVILAHLMHASAGGSRERSDLRKAMSMFFCYTTVFNAIELFGMCRSRREEKIVEDALGALKILGLNAKNGKKIGEIFRKAPDASRSGVVSLIGGLCVESRLPLMTGRNRSYSHVRSLVLVPASLVQRFDSAEALLRRSRGSKPTE